MLKASDIMTDEVATILGSATVTEAVKLMKFKNLDDAIAKNSFVITETPYSL